MAQIKRARFEPGEGLGGARYYRLKLLCSVNSALYLVDIREVSIFDFVRKNKSICVINTQHAYTCTHVRVQDLHTQ